MWITELDPWGQMDWVQEVAMPFHFQPNALNMLTWTHLGELDQDPSCLDQHHTCLQCYKLEYNQACKLIKHSLIAHLLDITW